MNAPQFLVRIQPVRPEMLAGGPTPAEAALIGQHFDYLAELAWRGELLLAGRTLNRDPSGFGIVIFTAPDEPAARRLMEADPAVRGGVFRAELYPYAIALVGGPLAGEGG